MFISERYPMKTKITQEAIPETLSRVRERGRGSQVLQPRGQAGRGDGPPLACVDEVFLEIM